MASTSSSSSSSIGIGSLLTVAFVVLKLLGKITWSWWWVLAPTWIPASIVFALFIGAVIWAVRQ